MLKDHLGNVRMVLTAERDTAFYPPASMETAEEQAEIAYYSGITETRAALPVDYPED